MGSKATVTAATTSSMASKAIIHQQLLEKLETHVNLETSERYTKRVRMGNDVVIIIG